MSHRAAIVEDFDDDTDLPLPSRPLPNTGSKGPLLQEIVDSDEEEDDLITGNEPTAGPATTSQFQSRPQPSQPRDQTIHELQPTHKAWSCIYPIYIDAKQPYGTGSRRILREKSVWWPLSKDIADAAQSMHLGVVHELNERHPKDWENPGRVRVEWKRDGHLINPAIRSKKQLLEAIALRIQRLNPANIPKPPYNTVTSNPTPIPKPSTKSAKSKSKVPVHRPPKNQGGRRLPIPPVPHPPLANRVSPYSPALPSGMFVEAVKAAMSAAEGGASGAGAGAAGSLGGAGMGKGKRKVVRVRG